MKINFKRIGADLVKNSSKITKSLGSWCKTNAPTVCTFGGIGGMGVTMYMVHKASPKYHEAVKDQEDKLEKAKAAAKIYWPAGIGFLASSACILTGNRIAKKRYLALAASMSLAQKELMATQESIVDNYGPEAFTAIRKKVADERNSEVDLKEEDIIKTNKGEELFYEPLTNHYFRSSQNAILTTQNELNALLNSYDEVNLNSLLIDLGVGQCLIAEGLFFTTANGYKRGCIDIDFIHSSVRINGENHLCWELVYRNKPHGEFPFPW